MAGFGEEAREFGEGGGEDLFAGLGEGGAGAGDDDFDIRDTVLGRAYVPPFTA